MDKLYRINVFVNQGTFYFYITIKILLLLWQCVELPPLG